MIAAEAAGTTVDELHAVARHWCTESTRRGAEYAQAFVEVAGHLRLDCTAGDAGQRPAGSVLTRRAGIGLLLRHRGSWWFGSASLAEQEDLARQMAAVVGGTEPAPAAVPAPGLGPYPESPWPSFVADGPHGRWNTGPEPVRLDLVQDFFLGHRVVADSHGVQAAAPVSVGRQRCTATVSGTHTTARSFTRSCGPRWDAAHLARNAAALARQATRQALDLLPARSLGHRRTPVVFGPKAGAALLHELIGHALEADNLEKSARLFDAGAPLCDAPLNLADDATLPEAIGSVHIDDDGQPGTDTPLVQRGMLVGRLTNKVATFPAAEAGTGNGRRQDYRSPSLPRATNTVVLPGPDDPERLREAPRGGLLYVSALNSGETVVSRGDFCFSAGEAYYLTPGGGRQPLRDVNLSGDARDTLRRLVGIADDVEGDNVTCGKQGQSVLIGLYSPTMLFDHMDWWC